MSLAIGSSVIRVGEPSPNRATVIAVMGEYAEIEYEEGGSGWWPISALQEELVGPDYVAFYNAFLQSSIYNTTLIPALLQPGSDVLGNAMTIVAIALQDAMAGRVPLPSGGQPNSLQSAIWLLMSIIGPTLSEPDATELQTLLTAHSMAAYYTLVPPT